LANLHTDLAPSPHAVMPSAAASPRADHR
jgi:hypothetical protein